MTLVLPEVTPEPTVFVTIIIEGPIQAIDGNTITIFDLKVLLSSDDPVLAQIRVGDVLRIEGNFAGGNQIITALQVTLVPNVSNGASSGSAETNVNPSSGEVWIDSGNCNNPPPPWAPAHGWRQRCEGAPESGNSSGQGMGGGDDDDEEND
jgi:hypothetical protein